MRVSAAIKSVLYGVTTDNKINADGRYFAEQINTIPRIDEGLTKRPPVEYVTNMGAPLATDGTEFVKDFVIHDVAYFLIFRTTGLTVFREGGTLFTIADLADDAYLTGATEDDIELAVQGEQVFVLNKTKTISMVANEDAYIKNSMLFVKSAPPVSTTFTVQVTNSSGTRLSITHTIGSTLASTATDSIASGIATKLDALTGIEATSLGSVIEILRDDNEYAEATAKSSFGNDFIKSMNGKVHEFDDLPRYSYHGHITEVQPEGSPNADPVYMKSIAESAADELASAPGAPTPWPVADFGNLDFNWHQYQLPPVDIRDFPLLGRDAVSGDWAVFMHLPAVGTMFMEGVEVKAITLQTQVFTTTSYAYYVYFKDGETPPVSLEHLRISENATPQVTHGSIGEMIPSVDNSHNDNLLIASSFTNGTNYSLWVNKVQEYPSALAGLIQVRWIEAQAPQLIKALDGETMPHLLVPVTGSAEFEYDAAVWDDRRAGDENTNPIPRFVDQTIEDIIIFQNRLTVMSNDEITTSATNNVLNFFRDTVTQVLSKHPVNIRSTSPQSSRLRHFVYHNRDLLICSARQQYKIDGTVALTPQTASMQLTTSYNASEQLAPVSIGDSVYIPSHQGEYLHLNKYEGSNANLAADSADSITQHVRKYISGTVNNLQGLPNHGLIFASASDGKDLFVCNYDTNKSRAEDKRFAWFKWNDFTDDTTYTISAISTSKNTLLIVINDASGLTLLNVDVDAGSAHKYIDFKRDFDTVATTVDVGTTYSISEAELTVVQGEGCPSPGDYVGVTSLIAGVVTLDEDMLGGTVHVGREFNAQAIPNLVSVRDEGGHVNSAANLRIRGFEVRVLNTGKMTATERSPYDTYETQEFTGLVSGSLDAITDQEATTSDVFKVGFKQHADVGTILIESKSWLPMTITQIDWVGNYKSRGRRF